MYNPKEIIDSFKKMEQLTEDFNKKMIDDDSESINEKDIKTWFLVFTFIVDKVIRKDMSVEYLNYKKFQDIYQKNHSNLKNVISELIEKYNELYPILRKRYSDILQ